MVGPGEQGRRVFKVRTADDLDDAYRVSATFCVNARRTPEWVGTAHNSRSERLVIAWLGHDLAWIVTVVAGYGDIVCSMAFHASRHRNIRVFADRIALPHRAVTGFARGVSHGEMILVAKVHIIRETVHSYPWYGLPILMVLGELLNARTVFPN